MFFLPKMSKSMIKQDSAGFVQVFVYYFNVEKGVVKAVKYAIIVALVAF